MGYDPDLADRLRELLGTEPGLSEKKMFGGLAFLVDGHMAIAASGEGGLLVRVDPDESDRLVASSKATVAVMRGRAMNGWLRVPPEAVRTRPQLTKWARIGVDFVRTLPPKH